MMLGSYIINCFMLYSAIAEQFPSFLIIQQNKLLTTLLNNKQQLNQQLPNLQSNKQNQAKIMKKSIINLKHPEHLYIKSPLFRAKRRCYLLIQLNQANFVSILNYLRLAEIVILYQTLGRAEKYKQTAIYVANYLATTIRRFSRWEQKQFLDTLLVERVPKNKTHSSHNATVYPTHSKLENVPNNGSLSNTESASSDISNQKSRLKRFRESIGNDVRRTYIMKPKCIPVNNAVLKIQEKVISSTLKVPTQTCGSKTQETNLNSSQTSRWTDLDYYLPDLIQPTSLDTSTNQLLQNYLNRVLLRLSRKHPWLGYIQGFNYLVKNMYLTGLSEQQAYRYMHYLIYNTGFGQVLGNNMQGIKQLNYVLKVYIYNYIPALHKYFNSLDIEPEIFATSWFVTLLSEDLPPSLVNKLWHLFALQGWKIFIQFCISLLCIMQKQIIKKDGAEVFSYMRRLMSTFNSERKKNPSLQTTVWKLMTSVEVSENMVYQLRRQMPCLQNDSEIQIWRIQAKCRYRTMSQKVLIPHNNTSESNAALGSQICCDRTQTASVSRTFSFPFCRNVTTKVD